MKNKLSKALVVSALFAIAAMTGCGGADAESIPEGNGDVTVVDTTPEDEGAGSADQDRPTVVMVMNQENGADDTNPFWKYDAVREMEDILNINLELRSQTTEQDTLMIAAREMPDIFLASQELMPQLILGDLIAPLDDLVDQYAPDLAAHTERLEFLRRFQSEGTGILYGITNYTGTDGHGHTALVGQFVRWDLYSQLGYPEVNGLDDVIDVLYEMVQLEPETPDGAITYGLGVFNGWGLWPYTAVPTQPGLTELSPTLHLLPDGTLVEPFVDFDATIWQYLRFYNRADQLGIFDRDSLIQTDAEYAHKATMGQYMSVIASWWTAEYNAQRREEDPDTMNGFQLLPYDGKYVFANNIMPFGNFENLYVIGADSQVKGDAMRLLNYLNSYDGVRQLTSGTLGDTIEMVDGRPEIRADIIENIITGGADADGLFWSNPNILGLTTATLHPDDGQPLNLMLTARAFSLRNSALDRAYSEHFGADFPFGVLQNFIDEGRMYDYSSFNHVLVGALESPPPNIQRIDNLLTEILERYIHQAIMAADDEEFRAVFESAVAELEGSGHQESINFWTENYQNTMDIIGEFFE